MFDYIIEPKIVSREVCVFYYEIIEIKYGLFKLFKRKKVVDKGTCIAKREGNNALATGPQAVTNRRKTYLMRSLLSNDELQKELKSVESLCVESADFIFSAYENKEDKP